MDTKQFFRQDSSRTARAWSLPREIQIRRGLVKRLCLTGFKVVDQPPKLLFSCSGSGEEAVVDFQHQGGESRDVNGIIAGGGAGLGRSRPGAVVVLRIE